MKRRAYASRLRPYSCTMHDAKSNPKSPSELNNRIHAFTLSSLAFCTRCEPNHTPRPPPTNHVHVLMETPSPADHSLSSQLPTPRSPVRVSFARRCRSLSRTCALLPRRTHWEACVFVFLQRPGLRFTLTHVAAHAMSPSPPLLLLSDSFLPSPSRRTHPFIVSSSDRALFIAGGCGLLEHK